MPTTPDKERFHSTLIIAAIVGGLALMFFLR